MTTCVAFSTGIRRITHLGTFLDGAEVLKPGVVPAAEVDAVLVWGRKSTGTKALDYAERHQIPVWYLEDGFIRSSSATPHSRLSYSLSVDDIGVYYDARSPSALENYLNREDSQFNAGFTAAERAIASRCLSRIVDSEITKYNFCKSFQRPSDWENIVLVVDQTRDDASVTCGAMVAGDFEDMLDTALAENPDARVVVKTHPDVLAGRRRGYLTTYADSLGVEQMALAVNPVSLLKTVERVYAGTSQLGFEALLCDKPVTLFGLPFYAGWGCTDDRKAFPRRIRSRTPLELFHAAYQWYTRYCSPVTGEACELIDCIEHVELQQEMFRRNSHHYVGVAITPWKRKYIRQYLRSPDGELEFARADGVSKTTDVSESSGAIEKVVVTWGYREPRLDADTGADGSLLRIEDGFLRGPGLGSDFTPPQSLVFDACGMYFNPSGPSELEQLLNHYECTLDEIHRAVALKKLILSRNLSKYEYEGASVDTTADGLAKNCTDNRTVILVVGQVEDDASLRFGAGAIKTNLQLLQAARERRPEGYIIYRPHPDVVAGNRQGTVEHSFLKDLSDEVCSGSGIATCIDRCDELHTMTSLSGFEALLRGKTVCTYGAPFYAGWGLTLDADTFPRRNRVRTLDELVYCALIAYPRYLDIESGEFMTPEMLVNKTSQQNPMNNNKISWSGRQVLKVRNVFRGLSYAP